MLDLPSYKIRKTCRESISYPGKFEGEPIYSPYLYECAMNGFGDNVYSEKSGIHYSVFRINPADRKIFPEFKKDSDYVLCWEDSNGFWCTEEVTESGYNAFMDQIETE
jgi:hypothetical protein